MRIIDKEVSYRGSVIYTGSHPQRMAVGNPLLQSGALNQCLPLHFIVVPTTGGGWGAQGRG